VVLGRVAIARRDLANAEREAKAAVASEPENANAQVLLAQVYANEGRYDEAMRIIDAVSNAHQQPIELLDFVRGDILARTRRNDEAIAAFQREIRNFPLERQAYANLAAVFFFAGKPDSARETMESFVRAAPRHESYLFAAETFDSIGARDLAASFRKRANTLR
jgi:tetratricopeptide (TPR) repeat protein